MGFPPDISETGGLDPDEAFALIGNEYRAQILRAIQDLYRTGEYPPSFSAIQAESGIDVSSQFSYHLQELVGYHVRKGDSTYGLTHAGWEAVAAIRGGTLPQHLECEEHTNGSHCAKCGAETLKVSFRHTWLFVECPSCETTLGRYPCPTSALIDRDATSLLQFLDLKVRNDMRLAANGTCRTCFGPTDPITYIERASSPEGRLFEFQCAECGDHLFTNLGTYLLQLPAIRTFCRSHGVDIENSHFWELKFCIRDDAYTVIDDDQWRCAARLELDQETFRVALDDELRVVDSTTDEASSTID